MDHETATIESILKKYGLCERQLERKFKTFVGVSPKTYQRISRFEKAMRQLRSPAFEKIQDVAFGLNYADHSHLIREFKEFSGHSPKAFLAGQKASHQTTSLLIHRTRRDLIDGYGSDLGNPN